MPLLIECRRQWTTPENCGDYPAAADLHELLDPSMETSASLWENSAGQAVAFAIMHLPYCNLYFFILPEIQDQELEAAIVHWGLERARAFGCEQGNQAALDTACRDTDGARLAMLARNGFIEQENQTLHMERSLREALPEIQMPEGFSLRHVAEAHEAEEYVALHREAFGTQNMTVEHRLSIMHSPDYRPELDLLAVAPDGTFAAFCFCTINAEANAQCGRKAGEVGTMGTRPQFRRRGLGSAMALAGMRRLQGLGMEVAWLTTGSWNVNAQRVFESLGFRTTYSIRWFSKAV
jgi:ribosomal protein S18 acetylase RimI-like enzyme